MSWWWVFLGGGLGAVSRYGLALLLPPEPLSEGNFPWATLLANLIACLLLGYGLSLFWREQLPRAGQLLLLTGFCGGFSTFSTFAAELLQLLQYGHTLVALTYLAVSVLFGILALAGVLYLLGELG